MRHIVADALAPAHDIDGVAESRSAMEPASLHQTAARAPGVGDGVELVDVGEAREHVQATNGKDSPGRGGTNSDDVITRARERGAGRPHVSRRIVDVHLGNWVAIGTVPAHRVQLAVGAEHGKLYAMG